MMNLVEPAAVIAAARSLIGVPFRHQGRNEHGLDCIGLVVLACERAGCAAPDIPGITRAPTYGRHINPRAEELLEQHLAGRLDAPRPGCLVVFRYPRERAPRHHGLMTESGTFVHADQSGPKPLRMVRETALRAPWTRRAPSFWRLPGVSYE